MCLSSPEELYFSDFTMKLKYRCRQFSLVSAAPPPKNTCIGIARKPNTAIYSHENASGHGESAKRTSIVAEGGWKIRMRKSSLRRRRSFEVGSFFLWISAFRYCANGKRGTPISLLSTRFSSIVVISRVYNACLWHTSKIREKFLFPLVDKQLFFYDAIRLTIILK